MITRRKSGGRSGKFEFRFYTLLFRSCHLNAVNFGGGVHCWFAKRAGMRLEVRDHFSIRYLKEHLIQGRVALVFR